MISICIPIYNFDVAKLVKALENEIVSKSLDCEIICIDDASQSTFRYCNSQLAGNRIHYIQLEENIGRARIRNRFLQYAKYEYLLFLDCDSLVQRDDFLSKYIYVVRSVHDSVICGGRVYPQYCPDMEHRLRWLYGHLRESKNHIERSRIPHHSFMTNNFMVSRSVLSSIQFNEVLVGYGHEDTLFGHELENRRVAIIHIDNPILNGYLETNSQYLEKTREAIASLHLIIEKIAVDEVFYKKVTLLRYSRWIEKLKLKRIFVFFYRIFEKKIYSDLLKGKSGMMGFDLYKMNCYLKY